MGSIGDSIYPFVVPCCGLPLFLLLIGAAVWIWGHRVDIDGGFDDDTAPPTTSATLGYARPRPKRRRRLIVRPPFRWAVGVAVGLYVVANVVWFAYLAWDHRTRTTTLLLVDKQSRLPVAVNLDDVYVDCPDAWSTSSVSSPTLGTLRVTWTHPCSVEFSHVTGNKSDRMFTLAEVDDNSPATITIPIAP